MRIFITGATGLVGKALTGELIKTSQKVTALSRNPAKAKQLLGSQVHAVADVESLDFSEFDAVINLAGEPIFDKHWTNAQKQKLWHSRIDLTQTLSRKINQAATPPHSFISGSAVGYYGDFQGQWATESSACGNNFTAKLCQEWEQSALQANSRVCIIRTANVLAKHGGMLKKLLPLYQWALGGKLGNGKQFMSWIHLQDMVNAILFLLQQPNTQGIFNLSAPNPVPNQKFNRILGKTLHRPCCCPAPEFALRLAFGERADLFLDNQPAIPKQLQEIGFQFKFEHLEKALKDLLD